MKNFLIVISFSVLMFTGVKGATVNCSNGECEFSYSIHYKYAKTYCLQTLSFEHVETQLLSFTILGTGQECRIIESSNEN